MKLISKPPASRAYEFGQSPVMFQNTLIYLAVVLYLKMKEQETNCDADFCLSVVSAIQDHFIMRGDTVIVDNASIHTSKLVEDKLIPLLQALNITLVYLPTYSPELNPIELVFSKVKHYIRHSPHRYNQDFQSLVLEAFSYVSIDNVSSFYEHCMKDLIPLDQQDFVAIQI